MMPRIRLPDRWILVWPGAGIERDGSVRVITPAWVDVAARMTRRLASRPYVAGLPIACATSSALARAAAERVDVPQDSPLWGQWISIRIASAVGQHRGRETWRSRQLVAAWINAIGVADLTVPLGPDLAAWFADPDLREDWIDAPSLAPAPDPVLDSDLSTLEIRPIDP